MHTKPAHRIAVPLVLLAVVVLFYWKLVLTNQYTWLENPDLANLDLPWLQFQAGEWHMGRFPLWDPNSWFGQSLFGQAQPGAAYPLNWLLFLAPLHHGWIGAAALNWYYVLTRYLAALTAYAFARDLGRSRTASLLAGCVYALGGYVASTYAPQMVNGAVWTPLVFLYLFRAERGERPWQSALLSGFFLGVGWLAGHHQMNLFVSLAAAGLWLWFCVRTGKLDRKMLRLAAASVLIAICASAFQTIPMAEYGPRAVRFSPEPLRFNEVVPYSVHEQYSLKPIAVLGIFLPNVDPKSMPYVGAAAFSLALLGAILAWNDRRVRWLAMIALGGMLFSLGPNSLLHGVLYSLAPLVDKARAPAAGTLLLALGLAPLAAFGLDFAPLIESVRWSAWMGRALASLGVVLLAASLVFFIVKVEPADSRIMITAICALGAAALLAAWRSGAVSVQAGAVIAVALVLFELGSVTTAYLPNRSHPEQNPYLHRLAEQSDLAQYIERRGEAARIEYDDNLIPYNIGDWYGLEAMNAYTASVASNIWDMDLFSPRAKDFFGIRFALAKTPPRPGLIDVFTGRSGLKVFENPTAYPRAWTVHEARTLPDSKSMPGVMADPAFDARRTVLLAGERVELGGCPATPEETQMPLHTPNRVFINVNLRCRGMVILTDSWFPGWRATVDGKSARIYEVYGGVRGVIAEAGEHVIEMHYRPLSVMLGAALSLLAALTVLVVTKRAA
jgi:drug/metabolite transporter superfamily protein YnfA